MNCKKGALQLIDSIISTMELIGDDLYDTPLELYNGSTFGKHFRHIYDFFNCLVEQSDGSCIDYCDRHRDSEIESSKSYAINCFKQLTIRIHDLSEESEMMVQADFEISSGLRPIVKTSVGREIMYAYDHAVHHLAIIKIGLKEKCPHALIDNNLGVAASTIRHQYAHD